MASKQGVKSKRFGSIGTKGVNSPSSSTTSSSKQFQETSNEAPSSPASSSVRSKPQQFYQETVPLEVQKTKENVTVTVRFRPLNPREIRHGEEIAWYADGDTVVRNEYNPSIAYAYDRVFGPTTTTRHVYDVAAQHVVSGAMEGINGTVFAYGVTSSGKTHTMHGDQRSPGIIPLAVKDTFSIIQETPNREFLLRVSYLEIYNEVVNDLLNPAGQNLRVREDAQGTFVEGIKEEVVLSPAHALSLIAAGEEHRHVGSTNLNLLSSRSHTIFTLTIESSPCGEYIEGEAVTLSQLNLIDLAGSESSKAETIGMRRREGSYINKSLLTLGTVISKLTEAKASHIPYRDSKLTRVLQSSLSGHGRVSLICTVTPSSSSSEETHNTLKFAHRAKHIEIQAAQNKIIDEKSLIKKYQQEIQCLKEELEQLKKGIVPVQPKDTGDDDIVLLKQKLEDGQVKLQSRLEQEEEAKAALLGRIQRLTKLILVSTKASQSTRFPNRPGHRRRHSFGEEELAYLPYKRRDLILEEENIDLYVNLEGNAATADDSPKGEKKTKKHGLLHWLKPRKRENALTGTSDKSSGAKSTSTPSTPQADNGNHVESRLSHSLAAESSPSADHISDAREDKDIHDDSLLGQETPMTSIKSVDHIDLLREQHKILSGEVALHSSALKRLSEETRTNPQNSRIHVEMKRLKDEIKEKRKLCLSQIEKMAKPLFIALTTFLFIFNLLPSYALYGSSSPVLQLTPANFNKKVLNSNGVVLVEFFAPWCGHCKALTPIWEKAATVLKGVVTVAALDAEAHQALAQQYGIKGFPTIKVFAPGKPPVDYQGARDVKPIAEFALQQVKVLLKERLGGKATGGSNEKKETTASSSVELNSSNFDELVIKSKELWIVEFFAPWCGHCKKLAPEWKRASNNLKGKVKLGHVDCDADKSLMSRFNVQGFPTILVFGADKDTPVPYEGARTASAIESFALEQLETNVAPPEVTELYSADILEEKCGSAAICFVAFLPDILDSKAEGRNKYLQQLLTVAEQFKRSPYSYAWVAAGKQPDLEQNVGVGGYGYPALVALNIKKAVYAPLKSAFELDQIIEFVKEAGRGGKGNLPLGGTPTIVKTEPWDGKDGEIIEEDEFSLEELMGEDASSKDEL